MPACARRSRREQPVQSSHPADRPAAAGWASPARLPTPQQRQPGGGLSRAAGSPERVWKVTVRAQPGWLTSDWRRRGGPHGGRIDIDVPAAQEVP